MHTNEAPSETANLILLNLVDVSADVISTPTPSETVTWVLSLHDICYRRPSQVQLVVMNHGEFDQFTSFQVLLTAQLKKYNANDKGGYYIVENEILL